MTRIRIKICCIASHEEARLAIAHGADALGLVGPMLRGTGVLDDHTIARIAASIGPPVATFLLTGEVVADAIIAHARRCRTNVLQLVRRVAPDDYARVRDALPGVKLVQVVHVTGPDAVSEAEGVAPFVDALLLDSSSSDAQVELLGATGRTHDWSISRRIVDAVAVPVFLAGGLRPDNVGRAIREVRPFGVDLCTGVRTDGRLDPVRLGAFVAAVRDAAIGSAEARSPEGR